MYCPSAILICLYDPSLCLTATLLCFAYYRTFYLSCICQ
uniref:Uncharacterized protein n=1 Tax=Anguilla anguilla TaxID=7936 RepID=A0A0E9TFN9_ANGAN